MELAAKSVCWRKRRRPPFLFKVRCIAKLIILWTWDYASVARCGTLICNENYPKV